MEEEVLRWWKQAIADLKSAKNCINSGDYYLSVFASQQAAEKALKALFISRFRKAVPKTHDMTFICDKLDAPEKIRRIAENLTPAYMLSRYPDVAQTIPSEFYSKPKALKLLKLAGEAVTWIKKELKF